MSKTTIPFGKFRGTPITNIPSDYLNWLSKQTNTDLNYWATLAKEELDKRGSDEDLEAIADDFLRQHGYNINGE